MASILELAFNGQVTIKDIRAWLEKENSCPALDEVSLVQAEFIQYFLNFLRDQSAPILQGCRSANATPSKTPTVLKSQRSITFGEPPVKTSTPHNTSDSKRIQLFAASPHEDDSLTLPNYASDTSHNESSFNYQSFNSSRNASLHASPGHGSRSHNSSYNTTASPCGPGLQHSPLPGAQISPHPGSGNRRRNRNNSLGPFTPEVHRSQHKHSLGEFFIISNSRKKKSPTSARREDSTPGSQGNGWKSGGKFKGHINSDKKRWQSPSEVNSPVFTLNDANDFPTLGVQSPASEESSCSTRTPTSCSRVITPSRKITTSQSQRNTRSTCDNTNRTTVTPRRITPTAIKLDSGGKTAPTVFMSITPSKPDEKQPNAAFSVAPEIQMVSLAEERKILREVWANRVAPTIEETTPQKTSRLREMLTKQFTPTKLLMDKVSTVTDAMPELGNVTYQDKLDTLAALYSICLKEYMVPNVTVELYFVVQLLTTRGLDAELALSYLNQDDDDEVCYLASVHNAVYFAVSVLEKQDRLLSLLDKGTLRLLVDNQRIADFSPNLRNDMLGIIEKSQTKVRPLPPSSPVLGVSFQADTDNRKNFPDDRAFHTFKKQRDKFYELLREWQENHMQPGWSMREAQCSRIKELVGSHIELTNHVHFARLFQSQLIMMCKGDRSHKVEGDDENISLLSELKLTNPAKFKRLQERFVSPQSVGSPCPHPSFPGCQEFFRDFINIASSHMFNHHLTHTMVEKISDLNGTQFSVPEGESDQEAQVDPEDLETLSMCLLTLRLLGKFLGFLTFLPYQSSQKLPDTMEVTIINMRNQVALPVDLAAAVQRSVAAGRTVLTTPWLVEFLSMMDALAPRLEQLQEALVLLVRLYRSVARELREGTGSLTTLLVVTSLGWLFELPIFPEGMFFKSFSYGMLEDTRSVDVTGSLDKMDLVDHNLFFTCCPYVAEVKSLLMGFAVGSNNKGSSIRKITPMLTESEAAGSVSEKQLQAHLEENFFHNHPASMKRTVEFVADRVSSNYIKKFRATHLPQVVQEGHRAVRDIISGLGTSLDTRSKRKARQQVEDLSLDLVTKAISISSKETASYALKNAGAILPLMLPEDTALQVIRVATDISGRLGQDKVVAWMTTHITKAMFVREYSPELEKHLKMLAAEASGVEGTPGWESVTTPRGGGAVAARADGEPVKTSPLHDEAGQFPSEILVGFKEVLRDLVMGGCTPTAEQVIYQTERIRWCLENRQDIISGVFKCMSRMTIDMAYTLAMRYPSLLTAPLKDALLYIWTKHLKPYTDFSHVICPKHTHAISSTHDQLAWQNLSDLIVMLLDNQLITATDLEESATAVLQNNLPEWLSGEIKCFIKQRVAPYRQTESSIETKPVSETGPSSGRCHQDNQNNQNPTTDAQEQNQTSDGSTAGSVTPHVMTSDTTTSAAMTSEHVPPDAAIVALTSGMVILKEPEDNVSSERTLTKVLSLVDGVPTVTNVDGISACCDTGPTHAAPENGECDTGSHRAPDSPSREDPAPNTAYCDSDITTSPARGQREPRVDAPAAGLQLPEPPAGRVPIPQLT